MQKDIPLQVALMGSWHFVLAASYRQFLQQGLFLSLWRHKVYPAATGSSEEVHFSDNLPANSTRLELAIWSATAVIGEM